MREIPKIDNGQSTLIVFQNAGSHYNDNLIPHPLSYIVKQGSSVPKTSPVEKYIVLISCIAVSEGG